jgi:hypothetical protein
MAKLVIRFNGRYGWNIDIDRETVTGFLQELPQQLYGGGGFDPDVEGRAAIQRMLREGFQPHTPARISDLIAWWLVWEQGDAEIQAAAGTEDISFELMPGVLPLRPSVIVRIVGKPERSMIIPLLDPQKTPRTVRYGFR